MTKTRGPFGAPGYVEGARLVHQAMLKKSGVLFAWSVARMKK